MPHTEADIRVMLDKIGVEKIDDLYADVPQEVIFREDYDIPSAMSEIGFGNLSRHLAPKTAG